MTGFYEGQDWARALHALHSQGPFKAQTWLAPLFPSEFHEICCALLERFTVTPLTLNFTFKGIQLRTSDDIDRIERRVMDLDDRMEIIDKVHEQMLLLGKGQYFADYNMSPVTYTELRAKGIGSTSWDYSQKLAAARSGFTAMNYLLLWVYGQDTQVGFYPYTREGFIYSDWPLPRKTDTGFWIEGYELSNTHSCFGEFLLTDKNLSRFQNRVKVALRDPPDPKCSWVYAHVDGGFKLLDSGDYRPGVSVADATFQRFEDEKEEEEPEIDAGPDFGPRDQLAMIPPLTFDYREVPFYLNKIPGATYYLLNQATIPVVEDDSELAYSTNVVRLSINNYTLPQKPDRPWDVTDFLQEGSNNLQLVLEGRDEGTDIYLLEALQLDTFIPPPAVIPFQGGCFEAIELGNPTTYAYSTDNEKCWNRPPLEDTVSFDVHGLVNLGFRCLSAPNRHILDRHPTTGLEAESLYSDQPFTLRFTQDVGMSYEVTFEYDSVNGAERNYEVVEGEVEAEITEIPLRVPTDALWSVKVVITFDDGRILRTTLSTWGIQEGQFWEPDDCATAPEVFTTAF